MFTLCYVISSASCSSHFLYKNASLIVKNNLEGYRVFFAYLLYLVSESRVMSVSWVSE